MVTSLIITLLGQSIAFQKLAAWHTCSLIYVSILTIPLVINILFIFIAAGVLYNVTVNPVNEVGLGKTASVLLFSKQGMTGPFCHKKYKII